MNRSEQLIARLKRFTELLRSGVPIEAKQVTVERTPDGPLTTVRHIVIGGADDNRRDGGPTDP